MPVLERRFVSGHVQVTRSLDPTLSAGKIVGYAALFSRPGSGPYGLSEDLGGFKERCVHGCFDRSLSRGDRVTALVNHDPSLILGSTKSGTLRLASDSKGLRFTVDCAPTSVGRDAVALIARGDMSQCSFAFVPEEQEWADEDDAETGRKIFVRSLRSVSLQDVSCVLNPAYPDTHVETQADSTPPFFNSARSFDQFFPQGLPAEVRSRVPNARAHFESRHERRSSDAIVDRRREFFRGILG